MITVGGRGDLQLNGTAAGATFEPGELTNWELSREAGVGTVWYRWRSPEVGVVRVELSEPGEQLLVGVFAGSSVAHLKTIVSPARSGLWVGNWDPIEGGMDYYIAVMGAGEEATLGDFEARLTFEASSPWPNDAFADALPLAGPWCSAGGQNVLATLEPGEEQGLGDLGSTKSLWYSWVAPAAGVLHSFCGNSRSGKWFHATPFRGDSLTELSRLTSLPDGGFEVTAGERLWIRIASLSGDSSGGEFVLELLFEEAQVSAGNDDYVGRLAIGELPYLLEGGMADATVEAGEPVPDASIQRTVWWALIPAESGLLNVRARAEQFEPVVACYRGEAVTDLVSVERLEETRPSDPWVTFVVEAGIAYAVQLGAAEVGAGAYSLEVFVQGYGNDPFVGALLLEGDEPTFFGDNRYATLEEGEMLPAENSAGRTLWHAWVAPSNARVGMGARPSCAIAVYRGGDLPDLSLVASGASSVNWIASAGERYLLQVDSAEVAPGPFEMDSVVSPFTSVDNDSFYAAAPLRGCHRTLHGAAVGSATLEPGEPDPGLAGPAKSVWWRWQAPSHGTWTLLRPQGLPVDLHFRVYQGKALSELILRGGGVNLAQCPVQGGEIYHLAVIVEESVEGAAAFEQFLMSLAGPSVPVPGNLLANPSFEHADGFLWGWELKADGGWSGQRGAPGADGISSIVLAPGTWIRQEIETEMGGAYEMRLAISGGSGGAVASARVDWGDEGSALVAVPSDTTQCWNWFTLAFEAAQAQTHVTVMAEDYHLGLDALSAVRLTAPRIVRQPESRSAYVGGQAVFEVEVVGGGDLDFQWFFEDDPIQGERDQLLALGPVREDQAGRYRVEVRNSQGRVSSGVAVLTVEVPSQPVLLMQPWGGVFPLNAYHSLSVLAAGEEPLRYQWFHDGAAVLGAEARRLVFESLGADDTGRYQVRVSNARGQVWSLAVGLTVATEAPAGGCVLFDNGAFGSPPAPVFDVDGITRLSGADYVAQVYAGRTPESMVAGGHPRPFLAHTQAGLIDPDYVELPGIGIGELCFVQVRAWESSCGASYEEARASGGRYGRSIILEIASQGPMISCASLEGLESFRLEAGRPHFNVGRLVVDVGTGGEPSAVWLWGEPDSRYLLERAEGEWIWRPWQVVTNSSSGRLLLPEVSSSGESGSFIRARILD
jgi:hypothetical protein